jgi:hypothetical protein
MIGELKNMFQEQTRVERYRVAMELFECKMIEGALVSAHVQTDGSYGADWKVGLYYGPTVVY